MDALFDKIFKIVPHPNADALELAIIRNFPCVVRKGEFHDGDWVFYIHDDAKLVVFDEFKNAGSPDDLTFNTKFEWQKTLIKYLGSGGRVKTIKLRGKPSMGILIRPEVILGENYTEDTILSENKKIRDASTGNSYLEKTYGVTHWSAPIGNVGNLDVLHAGLDEGMQKTDQENYENLDVEDLHLGETALITKKLDGTSTTVICYPDGKYSVASRTQTFNVERMNEQGTENIYTKYASEAIKAGLWYAKKYNKVISFRGECCTESIQNLPPNKDRHLNNMFVFGVEFPREENFFIKYGVYGSGYHFTDIIKECNDNGFNVKHVPIISEEVITMDLLKKYNDEPASFGEGVVLNVKCNNIHQDVNSTVWSFKSKSRDYLSKIH